MSIYNKLFLFMNNLHKITTAKEDGVEVPPLKKLKMQLYSYISVASWCIYFNIIPTTVFVSNF